MLDHRECKLSLGSAWRGEGAGVVVEVLCLGMKRTWELDLEIVGEPGEESEREVTPSLMEVERAEGAAATSNIPHFHRPSGGKLADQEEVGGGVEGQVEELWVGQRMFFLQNSFLVATSTTH